MLEFRVLGPVEVWRDERLVPVDAARQRDVLAVLLLNANRVVAAERLIDLVWGETPPASARNTLQTLVYRLRRRLADPGAPAGARQPLQTRSRGYLLLTVDQGRLDLVRFEDLLRRGRDALDAGSAEDALALLRAAEGLWRGPALDGVSAEPLLRVERPRLHELHQQAVELRVEAELLLGRYAEVVAELRRLVAEHPHREGPYGQLMRALYGCGRRAEALDVYRSLRHVLADELGVEPSRALQRLHHAVLRGELDLGPQAGPTVVLTRGDHQPVPRIASRTTAPTLARAEVIGEPTGLATERSGDAERHRAPRRHPCGHRPPATNGARAGHARTTAGSPA